MHFSKATLTALVSFTSLAAARITGITVPEQVGIGSTFKAIITTENYIQSVADVSIAFGIAPAEYAVGDALGTQLLTQKTLGPELSNTIQNITAELAMPTTFHGGEALIVGSLFSLVGARYEPVITLFNVTVIVANTTDFTRYVSSNGFTTIA